MLLIKYFISFTLLLSFSLAGAQAWTAQELDKANTAKNVVLLTQVEKDALMYINLCRMYPQKFLALEVNNYAGPPEFGGYALKSPYKTSLIADLKKATPIKPVYFDTPMYIQAKCLAVEQSKNGKVGHDRATCKATYNAECASYGMKTGRDIAIQLLIDHNVPSLGHRKIIMSKEYSKAGVYFTTHTVYKHCAVIDFAF